MIQSSSPSNKINNVAIIGEQKHGKTQVFQTILGNKCINEQNIQMIELANIIIQGSHTLNIFDTQGQIDKQLDIENIFRIIDGVILVVDVVEGIGDVTQIFLKMALEENIKPILFFSKFDEALEVYKTHEEALYQQINQILIDLNEIINTYSKNPNMNILSFSDGSVIFGSCLYKWGLDVNLFKIMHSKKSSISLEAILQQLWGDNYYDPQQKIWQNSPQTEEGFNLQKCFIEFLLNPLKQLQLKFKNYQIQNKQNNNENEFIEEQIFLKEFNLQECLFNTIIKYLPSPQEAILQHQNHFIECENEVIKQSIQVCNPQGPLIGYITKFIQTEDYQKIALCKIFSGTLQIEQNVKLIEPNYYTQNYNDLQGWKYSINEQGKREIQIQKLVLIKEQKIESITQIQCGNIVGILGLDQYINSNCIIADSLNNISIRPQRKKLENIVRIGVQPKDPKQLNKMIEAIKIQKKIDLQLDYILEDFGADILACSSYSHLNQSLRQLQESLINQNIQIINSEPFVQMKETVIDKSNFTFMAISESKNFRIYGQGDSISEGLVKAIENKQIDVTKTSKELALQLDLDYNWEFDEARQISCFGPAQVGPNILVNSIPKQSYDLHYTKELNSNFNSTFQWTTKEGILAEENTRGIKITLNDMALKTDKKYLRQIMPTIRKLFYACQLTAKPRLQEAYSKISVRMPTNELNNIFQVIQENRGVILNEKQLFGCYDSIINFYIPTSNSQVVKNQIEYKTVKLGVWQQQLDSWATIHSDPFQENSRAHIECLQIRKRKGLKLVMPKLEDYADDNL